MWCACVCVFLLSSGALGARVVEYYVCKKCLVESQIFLYLWQK
jgi:hypothetical protein